MPGKNIEIMKMLRLNGSLQQTMLGSNYINFIRQFKIDMTLVKQTSEIRDSLNLDWLSPGW